MSERNLKYFSEATVEVDGIVSHMPGTHWWFDQHPDNLPQVTRLMFDIIPDHSKSCPLCKEEPGSKMEADRLRFLKNARDYDMEEFGVEWDPDIRF